MNILHHFTILVNLIFHLSKYNYFCYTFTISFGLNILYIIYENNPDNINIVLMIRKLLSIILVTLLKFI